MDTTFFTLVIEAPSDRAAQTRDFLQKAINNAHGYAGGTIKRFCYGDVTKGVEECVATPVRPVPMRVK